MTIQGRPGAASPPEPGLARTLAALVLFTAGLGFYFALTETAFGLKHDMTEAFAWGREFQFGYHQHPPFWAWVCGLWFSVIPRTEWGFALLSAFNAGIGLWGAWRLTGAFAQGQWRMAGWALLLLTPFYTAFAYKYNANIIFISIWPWTLYFFVKSVRGGRFLDAVAFGVCAGFALMSKYYALILLATCFLGALRHPARARFFTSASPWIAVLTAAALSLPHAVWLLGHEAPPVQYLARVSGRDWPHVMSYTLDSVAALAGMNLAVIGLIVWARIRARDAAAAVSAEPEPGFLPILAFAPFALTIAAALAFRTTLKPEMMYGILPLVPLAAMRVARLPDAGWLHRTSVRGAIAVTIGGLCLAPAIAAGRIFLLMPKAVAPNQEIAREATRIWRAHTGTPLAIVGGSPWYDNAIAFFSPDGPHALPFLDFARALWVTPAMIDRLGILTVCTRDDRDCLEATNRLMTPASARVELTLSHKVWCRTGPPVAFILTIVPPRT